jgi:hypothetical protein
VGFDTKIRHALVESDCAEAIRLEYPIQYALSVSENGYSITSLKYSTVLG